MGLVGGEGRGGWKDRGRGRQRGREGEEEEGMRQSPNNTHVLTTLTSLVLATVVLEYTGTCLIVLAPCVEVLFLLKSISHNLTS